MIPRISSLRSFDILLHCQPDFEVELRVLRVLVLLLVLGERDWLLVDFARELVVLVLDFVLLEIGFLAKRGLQNGKVVLIITNS